MLFRFTLNIRSSVAQFYSYIHCWPSNLEEPFLNNLGVYDPCKTHKQNKQNLALCIYK